MPSAELLELRNWLHSLDAKVDDLEQRTQSERHVDGAFRSVPLSSAVKEKEGLGKGVHLPKRQGNTTIEGIRSLKCKYRHPLVLKICFQRRGSL